LIALTGAWDEDVFGGTPNTAGVTPALAILSTVIFLPFSFSSCDSLRIIKAIVSFNYLIVKLFFNYYFRESGPLRQRGFILN